MNRLPLTIAGTNPIRVIYLMTLFGLVLSGFAQMPIFKRYYIADIPGLGWLAQFYVTHLIHYLAAIIFIGISAYLLVDYLMVRRKQIRLSGSGYLRAGLLAGLLMTGIMLVIRNLNGVILPSGLIIFLDLAHLGLVVAFLFTAVTCLMLKKRWTTTR